MAGPLFYPRVLATSTTTGTGTYTLGSAVTGYQAFSVVGDGNTCYYVAYEVDGNGNPSGGWEEGLGTYTASGTTLARTAVLNSSNAGSAVNWLAGTRRIALVSPTEAQLPIAQSINGFRLTLESGVPVSTSDQTSKTTVYLTPYVHNCIGVYTGNRWKRYTSSELSLALGTLTSGKNYDVFVYDNSGTLTLELSAAWSSDTARTDALTTQDGVYVKSGATTRRYLGTIRTTSTTTTEDSATKRFVWNVNNQVGRANYSSDATSHTYTTGAYREWNGGSGITRVQFLAGILLGDIAPFVFDYFTGSSVMLGYGGLGLNSTTTNLFVSGLAVGPLGTSTEARFGSNVIGTPQLGYNYLTSLEYGVTGTTYQRTQWGHVWPC